MINKTVICFDIETTGLDPMGELENGLQANSERITTLCAIDCKGKEYVLFDTDEKKLLKLVLEFFDNFENCLFTGYNIISFDIKFIYYRAMKYGLLTPKSHIHKLVYGVDKWHNPYVCDLAHIFSKGFNRHRKCQLVLKHLGLPTKINDGAEAIIMFEEKRFEELLDYCLNDAVVEMRLFNYCKEIGILNYYFR